MALPQAMAGPTDFPSCHPPNLRCNENLSELGEVKARPLPVFLQLGVKVKELKVLFIFPAQPFPAFHMFF